MDYLNYTLYALLAWNLIIFILYGADKSKAKKGKRRISEKTLITTAFFMGSIGAVFGVLAFKHKTKKWKFRLLLPLAVLVNIAVGVGVYCLIYGKM